MTTEKQDEARSSLPQLSPEQRIIRIDELVAEMQHLQKHKPPNIDEALLKLEPLTEELRKLIGIDVSLVINAFEKVRPASHEEKKTLAKRLNDLFDGFGLRVKCPKTGKGAAIMAKTHGQVYPEGIFELHVPGHFNTAASMTLPKIELIPRDMQEKPRGRGTLNR